MEIENFEKRVNIFVNKCQENINEHFKKQYPSLTAPTLSIHSGNRYIKIVEDRGGQNGVYCFLDKTNGDVLKAASWKAPAKHARGNIFNQDNGLGGVTVYGGVYL